MFLAAGAGVVPLAGLIGKATEALAARSGAGVGGLLNATFGNAAELIIAIVILSRGPALYPVVKATLTGSIIGNLLLVLGASILAGGLQYRRQKFNRTAAGVGSHTAGPRRPRGSCFQPCSSTWRVPEVIRRPLSGSRT